MSRFGEWLFRNGETVLMIVVMAVVIAVGLVFIQTVDEIFRAAGL